MSHMKLRRVSPLFVFALGALGSAHAQYVGPTPAKSPSTVVQILKNPIDDQEVLLRGKLLKKLSSDKYRFSDGTGEIRVEIDNDNFPGQKVSETTVVEIYGEIEKDFLESPEIDVERITIVKP
ncbi:MAG: NirD/YgiW/YdeI family stress tolerance protein [Steroidobacteraceae bacterium]